MNRQHFNVDGTPKRVYHNWQEAADKAFEMGTDMTSYMCNYCSAFHIGHVRPDTKLSYHQRKVRYFRSLGLSRRGKPMLTVKATCTECGKQATFMKGDHTTVWNIIYCCNAVVTLEQVD